MGSIIHHQQYNTMKKITLIALSLITLLSACDKKEKKEARRLAQFEQIGGVNLSDENNESWGRLGQPDVNYKDVAFDLTAYPVPAMNIQNLILSNKSDIARTCQVKIVNAYFKDAPSSFPENPWSREVGFAGKTINIENLAGNAGEVVFSKDIIIAANDHARLAINVTDFKQGFYRIIIEVEGERKYWDNLWVFRK